MTSPTVTAPLWLENIVNWGKNCPNTDQVLTTAFEAEDYLECIKDLWKRGVDPLSYINNLGNVCAYRISMHRAQIFDKIGTDSRQPPS